MNYFNQIKKLYSNSVEIRGFQQLNKKGLFPEEEILVKKYLKPGSKVLVIGCGAGRECFVLAKTGFEVVGVDISKKMISVAKEISKKKKLKIKFFESNILDFNSKKESFDYILMFEQMYNLIPTTKNRCVLLKKIHSLLKKEGLFMFSVYSKFNWYLIFPFLLIKFPCNLFRNIFLDPKKFSYCFCSKYSSSNNVNCSRKHILKSFVYKAYYAVKMFARDFIFMLRNLFRFIQKHVFKKTNVLEPGDILGNPGLYYKDKSLNVVFKYFSPRQVIRKLNNSNFKLIKYYSRDKLLKTNRFMHKTFSNTYYYVAKKA